MDSSSEPEFMRLVAAGREGDREALDVLVRTLLPQLRAYVRLNCGPLVRAREAESDLVQSICREVLEDIHQFDGDAEARFRSWLFTLTINKIQARYRFHTAQRRDVQAEVPYHAPAGGDDDREVLTRYGDFCTPSQDGMAREELGRIEEAFEQLSDDYRQVITLACVVGLSHREIAAEMGRPETAVRKLLSRARARLALLLATEEDG